MPYAFTEHHWNWSDIELAPLFVSDYWHTAQEAISSRGEVSIGWNRTQRKFHHLQQANEAPVSVPTADFDEFVFEIELQQYLTSKGPAQRTQRRALSNSLLSTEAFGKWLWVICSFVAESPSQDVIGAAIDLLATLGGKIADFAIKMAFAEAIPDANVAFVVAAAAAYNGPFVPRMLLKSQHRPVREGVIETVAACGVIEAESLLSAIASSDESLALRVRAKELLEEM
jgi:hypothetical protein